MDPLTMSWVMPLIGSGISGLGSALGGGATGQLGSFGYGDSPPTRMSVDRTLFGRALAPIESVMSALAGRATQPFTMPGAFVQQPGIYGGAGVPFNVAVTAIDPGIQRPGLLGTPGFNLGETGAFGGPFDPDRYREQPVTRRGLSQSSMPQLGTIPQAPAASVGVAGSLPQLQGIFEMLGVHHDPLGNLFMGGTALHTGANQPGPPSPTDVDYQGNPIGDPGYMPPGTHRGPTGAVTPDNTGGYGADPMESGGFGSQNINNLIAQYTGSPHQLGGWLSARGVDDETLDYYGYNPHAGSWGGDLNAQREWCTRTGKWDSPTCDPNNA